MLSPHINAGIFLRWINFRACLWTSPCHRARHHDVARIACDSNSVLYAQPIWHHQYMNVPCCKPTGGPRGQGRGTNIPKGEERCCLSGSNSALDDATPIFFSFIGEEERGTLEYLCTRSNSRSLLYCPSEASNSYVSGPPSSRLSFPQQLLL